MKGCIILFGESFRLGGQFSRNIGSDQSYHLQIQAANSHIDLIKNLNSKNINIDVFISSYETKFSKDLIEVYKDVLIGNNFYKSLIGQESLIYNAINTISNIKKYDFLLIMRIDLYLKKIFKEIFDSNIKKILWASICFKPYHKCGIHPRVNDMMLFVPKKYYDYLSYIHTLNHNQWEFFINNTKLKYDDLDTILKTYHDSDSSKDFNPLYYIVNRPESNIHHTKTDLFNKWEFK
jgi:hypothetical protein